MKKIHIIIKGIVTGVGFRWWLKERAKEKNIYGWVRNRSTNDVEAIFIGQEKNVNEIIKICNEGPDLARVENIEIKNFNKEYLKKSFDILNN